MEQVILRKLDEMFHDLREEVKLKHLRDVHLSDKCRSNVHQSQEQQQKRRMSLPSGDARSGVARRSSLPILPARRDSKIGRDRLELPPPPSLVTSLDGADRYRKFSRDSIDGADVGAALDNSDSVIFEEDEDVDGVDCVVEVSGVDYVQYLDVGVSHYSGFFFCPYFAFMVLLVQYFWFLVIFYV